MDINPDLLQWPIFFKYIYIYIYIHLSTERANKFAGNGIKYDNISNKE